MFALKRRSCALADAKMKNCSSKFSLLLLASVADPHHFDADPDPAFHFDADPDPSVN